jgi:predicted outer membrane repeat protein
VNQILYKYKYSLSLSLSLSLRTHTFQDNIISSNQGTGLTIVNSTVMMSNSSISGNTALTWGGGIYATGSVLEIVECNISNLTKRREEKRRKEEERRRKEEKKEV